MRQSTSGYRLDPAFSETNPISVNHDLFRSPAPAEGRMKNSSMLVRVQTDEAVAVRHLHFR